ncbi:hypothetical protein VKT23_020447 [Stygiomarasmius scandens]|uniref:Protein kinase domain-containing protein n=1 Tax=Marasmiellus scandens TaxID=2682957 RepID=A0ABR1IJ19_9AGAR
MTAFSRNEKFYLNTDTRIYSREQLEVVAEESKQASGTDTPRKIPATASASFRQGDLEDKRLKLLDNLGNAAYLCNLTGFLQHYLPPLPEGVNISEIIEKLRQDKKVNDDNLFEAFCEKPKEIGSLTENKIFFKLREVFEAIMEAITALWPKLKQNFDFRLNPDVKLDSDRKSSTKPDAYWVNIDMDDPAKGEKIKWYNLGFPAEFKKGDNVDARDDDIRKLLYNMQQTMSLDPRRRFTFGLTVENVKARLWFCCRGCLLATEDFNFMKDLEVMVHFFVSVAFASETQLGWDPSIRLNEEESSKQRSRIYDIDFDGETYTTQTIITDHSAEGLLGRGTRVWRVKKKEGTANEGNDSKRSFVLKDAWINTDGRLSEEQIYRQIKEDVESLPDKDSALELFLRHVMKPRSRTVQIFEDGKKQDDNTFGLILRGFTDFLNGNKVLVLNKKKQLTDSKTQSVGLSVASLQNDSLRKRGLGAPARPAQSKRHERNLYEQFATTLYDETSLENIFKAVSDTAKVLKVIHAAGWVHRDISVNNVYFSQDGFGVLSDLEYAKKKQDATTHSDFITGTIQFMASEVARQKYLYHLASLEMPKNVFRHNDLHDLESLRWILVWILVFRDDTAKPLGPSNQTPRERLSLELFPNQPINRREFLDDFPDISSVLSPTLIPAATVVRALGIRLRDAYQHAERELGKEPQIDEKLAGFPEAHDAFLKVMNDDFKELVDELAGIELEPISLSDVQRPPAAKRARTSTKATSSTTKKGKNLPKKTQAGSSTERRQSQRIRANAATSAKNEK